MDKIKIYLLFILVSVFAQSAFSQKEDLKGYAKRLSGILRLDDINEQKYQLTIFNEEFNAFLRQDKSLKEENIKKPLVLVHTDDNVYSIFYYTLKQSGKVKYYFFVRYKNDRGEVQVHTFEQGIVPDVKLPENIKVPSIRMTIRVLDGIKFYEMSFTEKDDPLVWLKYSDLKLKCLFEEIKETKNDDRKKEVNEEVLKRLRILWKTKENFDNYFPGLTRMKTIFSGDKKIKICTYGIIFSDFSNLFYGAVIQNDDKDLKVFELIDKTAIIRSPSRVSLPNTKWYGAIYLDIIETRYQKKTYYTLLGYKGQDEFVKTRVVDVLWFAGNKPRFGAPVFKNDRVTYNRLIFKYSTGANMVLRYDAEKKMIVMDNLESSDSMYKDVYRFYGPDFTYNGYKFEKGKWVLYEDIDLRNK
ncbi:MAG: hypothetical protein GXO47_10125 [Chlorobi bacterium]|nr:hypothetical protein [Chlorobiota bacterium]